MNVPCQHCTERYVGCHSVCEKYKAYKEYIAKIRDAANPKGRSDIMEYKTVTYERYARFLRQVKRR